MSELSEEEKKAIEYTEQFIGIKKEYKYKPIKVKTLTNTREAIETVLNLIENQQAELEKKDRKIKIKDEYLKLIWQIGYDYDGCNTVDSLKDLIDELVSLASKARRNDDKTIMYTGTNGVNKNILFEKVEEENDNG